MSGEGVPDFRAGFDEDPSTLFDRMRDDWNKDSDMFFNRSPNHWGFSSNDPTLAGASGMDRMRSTFPRRFASGGGLFDGDLGRGVDNQWRFDMNPSDRCGATDSNTTHGNRERIIPIQVEHGPSPAREDGTNARPRHHDLMSRDRANSCPPDRQVGPERVVQRSSTDSPKVASAASSRQRGWHPGTAGSVEIPVIVQRDSTPPSKCHQQTPPANDGETAEQQAALARIEEVRRAVDELAHKVRALSGVMDRQHRDYIYLDEMLTRQLLVLDNVQPPEGDQKVRAARRSAIQQIQSTLSELEQRIVPSSEQHMDTTQEPGSDTAPMESVADDAANHPPENTEEANGEQSAVVPPTETACGQHQLIAAEDSTASTDNNSAPTTESCPTADMCESTEDRVSPDDRSVAGDQTCVSVSTDSNVGQTTEDNAPSAPSIAECSGDLALKQTS